MGETLLAEKLEGAQSEREAWNLLPAAQLRGGTADESSATKPLLHPGCLPLVSGRGLPWEDTSIGCPGSLVKDICLPLIFLLTLSFAACVGLKGCQSHRRPWKLTAEQNRLRFLDTGRP